MNNIKEDINYYLDPIVDIPIYRANKKKNKSILVLSGGGIRGIAYFGALKALEELDYLKNINTFAGTSVGAIISGLYIIGYTSDEIFDFILKFDITKIKSINIFGFLEKYGIDDGEKFETLMKRLIKKKIKDPEITLSDLYLLTNKKIILTTVCVNTAKVVYLSHENFPDLPLYKAIRMSMSVPIYYHPVTIDKKIYIDGGCIDNYPINIFKDRLNQVIGLYVNENTKDIEIIDNTETYLLRLLECFMKGMSINAIKNFENNTINISLDSINFMNFDIDEAKKKEIFKAGYDAIINSYLNYKKL